MIPTKKSFLFAIARLTLLLALTGCYNPEYTEEDCEGMLLGLAVNELLPGPPNATPEEKAALSAKGFATFSSLYLYCRAQIPPQDPLDRATGINIF
ncbi:MAG: hypothetical protein F9K24_04040 [Leptonema illini]|uniref:Uncharacterized protein n=1 Tax=Leptonema illini TaxID=183 RepID=A0A833H3F1_9LEPT|nr:MAG: hypothetical protein F9K24_04040 [Leptonema illini]